MFRVVYVFFVLLAALVLAACGNGRDIEAARGGVFVEPMAIPEASPSDAGLDVPALEELADLAGGHGVVVRHGRLVYSWGDPSRPVEVASACKPVISTLLMFALQEGLIDSADDRVVKYDSRLKDLPGEKDQRITFRYLASQTSGYGHKDSPGTAWAYNDYALAYYYDVLTGLVFERDGEWLLLDRLGQPLGFEDPVSFHAGHAGRLAISARDFAKFGLFYLQKGRWNDKQLLKEEYIDLMVQSVVPHDLPRTLGKSASMLPGQRTLGGRGASGRDLMEDGPGYYSFNWWINHPPGTPEPLYSALPASSFAADGHVHRHMLWVIPEYDMVVVWLDTNLGGNRKLVGRATELVNASVAGSGGIQKE